MGDSGREGHFSERPPQYSVAEYAGIWHVETEDYVVATFYKEHPHAEQACQEECDRLQRWHARKQAHSARLRAEGYRRPERRQRHLKTDCRGK